MFFSKTVGQKKTWPTAGPNDDLSTIQTCLVPLSKSIEIHDEAKVLITKKICKTATCEFSHQGEVSVLSYLSQKSAKTKYRLHDRSKVISLAIYPEVCKCLLNMVSQPYPH